MKKNTLLLLTVLMTYCMGAWADGDWTVIEQPTCSKYGTMQNPANTSELRLVPKLAHHFGDDGKCTVCQHAAPTKYSGTPATSLATITENNYEDYGLTEKNKGCVMGWTVITTAEEFMKYMDISYWIKFNAFLAEDIFLDNTVNLPERNLDTGYVLDGTGHTISDMYRNDENFVGLYNNNDGTIRNLGLISPKIEVNSVYGGCICGFNRGTIENCFVIDGKIIGTASDLYGIACQGSGGTIINCYAISNKGNVGWASSGTITNSYAATTGSNDFYSKTLSGLNANKVNGTTWIVDALHSIPCMMMPSIGYYSERPASCTEGEIKAHWYCTVCNKYFLDACHSQEAPIGTALGHDMKHFTKVEPTCVATGIKEYYHCERCEKNFEEEAGTTEVTDIVIPINPQKHPSELQHFAKVEPTCVATGSKEYYHCDQCLKNFEEEAGTTEVTDIVIPANPDNHSLALVNDKAHCDRCNQDFSDLISIDNKTILLTKENDEYYLKADDDFTLQDGVNYLAPVDFIVDGNFTYSRDVSRVQKGAWQCWYEPFDLELTTDVLAKMDVAEVAGVLLDNEGSTIVAFKKIETGWIKANTPYVFRPKNITGGELELKMTAPQLYKSAETTFYNMSTYDKFTFGGNYKAKHNDNWYTLNLNGQFQKMKEDINLKGQRFWMTITARDEDEVPYGYGEITKAKEFINFTVLGDDETTGIKTIDSGQWTVDSSQLYDLQGRKVKNIQHGQIYIMNGKKYIVR